VVPVGAGEPPLPDPLEPIPHDEVSANFDISDGDYTGTLGMRGVFWFADQGVFVIWDGEGIGPTSFAVSDGAMTGTWSLSGSAVISSTGPISISGTNTWSMDGALSGDNPYMIGGSGQGISQVSTAGFTTGGPYPINMPAVPLSGVVQVCGQVLANWDQAIDEGYEGLPEGFGYSIPTYIALMPTNSLSELESRLEDLMERGVEIQGDLSRDPIIIAGDLASLLLEAEELLEDIAAHPDDCPPDPSFLRLITQVVADVTNTFLNQWANEEPDFLQTIELQRFVEVGLRAGAIGAGAADPAAGEYLQAKAEQILQRQFDQIRAQEPLDETDLAIVAVTATMLGYTFDTGISGPDICLVLDSC
jgi:hypothetical protein